MEEYPLTAEAWQRRLIHSIVNDPALRIIFIEDLKKEDKGTEKKRKKLPTSRHG
jgi:hypothetical protein